MLKDDILVHLIISSLRCLHVKGTYYTPGHTRYLGAAIWEDAGREQFLTYRHTIITLIITQRPLACGRRTNILTSAVKEFRGRGQGAPGVILSN